ncbi:MAG: methylated-DNA--[protein]-cysteine S-methyltransferase [Actinomycetota bacterium]
MKDIERALSRARSQRPEDAAARAAARLAARAHEEGLLDVAYAEVESPFGTWMVAQTPRGIVKLAFADEDFENVLRTLAARISPRVLRAPERLDEARRELDEYFEGARTDFDVPIDRSLTQGFALRVLQATSKIPYGSVMTYGQIAARAGNPRAYRAAGNALGSNPVPVVCPCHRVVRSGGDIGNYGGGPPMKRSLLMLEGALEED